MDFSRIDPLISISGEKIENSTDWENYRREEIMVLLSCKLATPVYELYGLKGVVADERIEINKAYHDGMIAYHRADGDHNLDERDWKLFMDFADKHLKD